MYWAEFEWDEPRDSRIGQILSSQQVQLIRNPLWEIGIPHLRITVPPALGVTVRVPILEDFTYEVKSNFESQADAISSFGGIASSIIGLFQALNKLSALGGETGMGNEFLNFQVWQNTEPFRMNLRTTFHRNEDPYGDVYLPAITLMTQSIMSEVGFPGRPRLILPGVNAKNKDLINRAREDKSKKESLSDPGQTKPTDFGTVVNNKQLVRAFQTDGNKILNAFRIYSKTGNNERVNLLEVAPCFIETAKPTWSKNQTESGYPLWCEMDVTVQSIFSAVDTMFSYNRQAPGGGLVRAALSRVATSVFR